MQDVAKILTTTLLHDGELPSYIKAADCFGLDLPAQPPQGNGRNM